MHIFKILDTAYFMTYFQKLTHISEVFSHYSLNSNSSGDLFLVQNLIDSSSKALHLIHV